MRAARATVGPRRRSISAFECTLGPAPVPGRPARTPPGPTGGLGNGADHRPGRGRSPPDTISLYVAVDEDQFATPLPVARRSVAREELRTAPRFTRPPDSALAARIARERALIAAAVARAHATPRLWSEPFTRPRAARIRSRFGLEREFNDVVESRHLGIDFDGRRGAPVRAANRGVVVLVENLFYAGRTIYLDHGAGLLTAYMHLDRALVAHGNTVQRDQLIGRVGATGRVTGPHLHWLARYGTILVDPLDLVTLDLTPLTGGGAQ